MVLLSMEHQQNYILLIKVNDYFLSEPEASVLSYDTRQQTAKSRSVDCWESALMLWGPPAAKH